MNDLYDVDRDDDLYEEDLDKEIESRLERAKQDAILRDRECFDDMCSIGNKCPDCD